MLNVTITKIASNGIPAYSVPPPAGPLATTAQTVPYKDIGFKGIEIHSPVLVSVTSDTGIVNVHSGIATCHKMSERECQNYICLAVILQLRKCVLTSPARADRGSMRLETLADRITTKVGLIG